MAVQDALSKIARGFKDLQLRWNDTRIAWRDETATSFEAKYLQSWERDFRNAAGQLETMSIYLGQVRRDCD